MISFKNKQNVQPLFDYYLETDLDSFDDQPVDYSKKYADQDSYEDCVRTKRVPKTNEFPSEMAGAIKQSYNDEVKVYCIEGTPLTISSASSFGDLREIGTPNADEKSGTKRRFSSLNDTGSPESFDMNIKKSTDSPEDKKVEMSPSLEKDDLKEGKSVSFRDSNNISKASSPLMFSRSSSIASLNSFEQQSIVDDRSSVSIFSALTSGLISPSDLPDSPGEVMSPTFTDKTSSPKVDVTKFNCGSAEENNEFSENSNIDPEKIPENAAEFQISIHESKEFMPMDSYNSEQNCEEDGVLIEHLEVSNDSLDIDEVFENPEYETSSFPQQNEDISKNVSDDESDGEDNILLQQCIKLGMPNKLVEEKTDMNLHKKGNHQLHPQNVSTCQAKICEEIDSTDINIEDFVKKENVLLNNKEMEILEEFSEVDVASAKLELKNLEESKSIDDSDEDDELLKRCIELGMPKNTPVNTEKSAEKFAESHYLPQSITYPAQNDLFSPSCPKSDEDSDADDILLQQCIKLGMPSKSSKDKLSGNACKIMETPITHVQMNASQVPRNNENKLKDSHHPNKNNVIPHPCMQYRMPYKTNEKTNENAIGAAKYTSSIKNIPKNSPSRMMYPMKTEIDSDGDEDDELLKSCIERGMPKESYEKRRLHTGSFRKSEYNAHSLNYHSSKDRRDNCPDGISDNDEENELLTKCIRAGMPSSKPPNDIQNRLCSTQTGGTSRKAFTSDTGIDLNKKMYHPRLPQNQPCAPIHSSGTWISNTSFIDIDSMRIYRTEDTPILSPSASISDLSSLSFNESFLNNSRNSDCSSDSDDDDELLLRCIRSGMPEAKRAVA